MPDGEDYAAFDALLARAQAWTKADVDRVMWIRKQQVAMLEAAHPKDRKGRERLQGVLDNVDRAIAVWRACQD